VEKPKTEAEPTPAEQPVIEPTPKPVADAPDTKAPKKTTGDEGADS